MKLILALAIISLISTGTLTYAGNLKSIPVEDQGPGGKKGGKKGDRGKEGKDKEEKKVLIVKN